MSLISVVLASTAIVLSVWSSHRVRRGLQRLAARAWMRLRPTRMRDLDVLLAELEEVAVLDAVYARLPRMTRRAIGVDPVTLYLLDQDGSRYVPMHASGLGQRPGAIGTDEPLVAALRRGKGVRCLDGRSDDLHNAAIHAVNGVQIEQCRASCAVPLRQERELVGFLLCGRSAGTRGLGLDALGGLERLASRCQTLLSALAAEADAARRAVAHLDWAEEISRRSLTRAAGSSAAVLTHETNAEVGEELRLAGSRGGYESTH